MLAKIGLIAFIPFLLLGAFLVTTDTVVVDVREGGPDGHHIVAPVPLPLAKFVLNCVPDEETTIVCPELWRYRDTLVKVVDELRYAPDGELVRVEEPGTFVSIVKNGSDLDIEVHDGDSDVEVKFPLKAAARFLARLDGEEFQAKDLLAAATNTMSGQVVHVTDGNDEVKISVW